MRHESKKANGAGRGRQRRHPKAARSRSFPVSLGGATAFLLFAAAVYGVLMSGQPPLGVELGEPSPRTFMARVSFQRVDLEATRAARQQAQLSEPAVWQSVPDQWQRAVEDLLAGVQAGPKSPLWERLPDEVDRTGLAPLMPLLKDRADQIRSALDRMGRLHFAGGPDLAHSLVQEGRSADVVLRSASGEEAGAPSSELKRLDPWAPAFRANLDGALRGLDGAQAGLARQVIAGVLRPSVVLDVERSTGNADRAAASVPDVTEVVEQGRVILAAGTEVRKQHVEDLERERRHYWSSPGGVTVRAESLGGLAVLLLLVLGAATIYAVRYRPELPGSRAQMLAFAFVTLLLVGVARLCIVRGVTPLWVPVPLVAMVMCLVYGQRFGLGAAVLFAVLVRLACPGADFEFMVLMVGGVAAALLSGQVRTRTTLIKAGALTGGAQFAATWGLGLMSAVDGRPVPLEFWQSPLLLTSLTALANGVMSGFVVSGVLPGIERLFGVTTDIRLLEWSDPNQPLLQQLLVNAPGSYHHSMVVGSLAADAAEVVGANPLLARVSAYFHDVGKLSKPEYFAENQPKDGRNPHDELSPTMSSLIITAHPKDGAEMAEQHGVPRAVRDIILQSHGSCVLKFFWDKAQKSEGEQGKLDEHNFRYRLPKPRGKEAAVVMVCDAAESAARSMGSPSVSQIQDLVHGIILDRLHDGQLDESGLTITDLKKLEDCLVRGLTAVFHSRVPYPGQEQPQVEQDGAAGARAASGTEPSEATESNADRDREPPADG